MMYMLLYADRQALVTELVVWVVGVLLLVALVVLYFVQRKKRKELEDELTQLNKMKKNNIEYEFVLKAMRLATWHVDVRNRQVTSDNDFREKMDSYVPSPGTLLDDWAESLVETDRNRVMKSFDDICCGRTEEFHEIYKVKVPYVDKTYWEESYCTIASRDAEGNPEVLVGTSACIDERKSIEAALVLARNKAEESDRLKSAFIANMSHEIRTPLNAIIGFTSVLPDIEGAEERRELINLIQENNQKLLRIIDDVMNISKIEAGKEQLVMTSFDLNLVLKEIADRYEGKVGDAVKLSTMFCNATQNVTTDLNRLVEVVDHMMDNAVKFTSKGSVILGTSLVADSRLRIWVRDTGKGISEENQNRVFERFFKVDEFVPGAGLGLSICRTMAYSLGGEVGVESKLGEGSTFWFEITL